MKRVLVADTVPEQCISILKEAGLDVDYRPGLSLEELKKAVKGVHGIICRSGIKVTEDLLAHADVLEAVCRAGVGVDNIDVPGASRRGVVVMNTPAGNTVSTAEHVFALLLGLARNLGPAYISMREGRWEKKKFMGSQLAGSTLGIVGLGRVGQAVAKRAVAFGMNACAYDPYVSRKAAEGLGVKLFDGLDELLRSCDYLTVHVPENNETGGMIGARQIAMMRDGACIINCARGSVVDQDAVMAALKSGKLSKAAFDVYAKEPPDSLAFAEDDRVLATPHLGASTEEAQMAVATEAAEQLVEALYGRHVRNAVNLTSVPPEEMKFLMPYCELAARMGRLVAQINRGRPQALRIACRGELAHRKVEPIVSYGAMGVMQCMLGDGVNIVSAPQLAEERGVLVTSSTTLGLEAGFTDLLEVTLTTDTGSLQAAGTVFGNKHARIVRIDRYHVEIVPEGRLLIVWNNDVPGVIGKVGAALGSAGVNIARMACGREEAGGTAMLALNLDGECGPAVVDRLRKIEDVVEVVTVEL
jgi:D-3-phosphoglycerate dehydrogenase